VESDITTNANEGRTYVILISLYDGQEPLRTRRMARRFIEETLGSNDEVAVIHVLDNMSKAQGFTSSRSLILAAIDRSDSANIGEHIDQIVLSFRVLEEVSERLGLVNGRRKAVIWFNAPSFFVPDDRIGGVDPRGASRWFAMRDALRAATRNNVAIYPIGLGMQTTDLGLDGLKAMGAVRALAEDTGGEAIINTNNVSPGFQRVVRDNSTYYLLGYVPVVEHRDGKFHTLTVRVKNRPELTVRARSGYYAPEPDAKAKPHPPVVEGLSVETADAVRMPSSMGDLGIDLFAAPFKGDGLSGSVLLGAQLRGTDLVLGGNERIEIAYQAMTTEGAITSGAFKVFTLDYRPESRADIVRIGLNVMNRIELPKGRHQVRFAVHQPNGKTGSVVADVEIPDYNAPLTLSGVVIGSQQTVSHRSLQGDDRLKAILSSDPTALRRFARRDVITAYVEVYTDPRRPEPATVFAVVTPAKGGRSRPAEMMAVPGESGRTGYVMRMRLADLSPGDHVLNVRASTARATGARQVPLTVSSD